MVAERFDDRDGEIPGHVAPAATAAVDCYGMLAACLKPRLSKRSRKSRFAAAARNNSVHAPGQDHVAARTIPASSFLTVLLAHAIRGVLCAMPNCPCAFSTMMPPWPFKRWFR